MRLGNKDSRISVRVSNEFDNWLSERAFLSHMSQSDYIRFVLEDFRRSVLIAEKVAEVCQDGNTTASIND